MTEQEMTMIVLICLVGVILLLGIILILYIQYQILKAAVKNGMIAGYDELTARRMRQRIAQMGQENVWSGKQSLAQKAENQSAAKSEPVKRSKGKRSEAASTAAGRSGKSAK